MPSSPKPPAGGPSLRTIAASAGVTSMTVSLALRDHPSISSATRARIKRLAAEQGYRPDPAVTKLMHHLRARRAQRTHSSLGGLRTQAPSIAAQGYFYGDLVAAGARHRAELLGFRYEEILIDAAGLTPRRLQRIIANRGVEGLVVLPLNTPMKLSSLLDWAAISAVAATSAVLEPRLHTVMPDHFVNVTELCRQLSEQGLKRIGLATHAEHIVRVQQRMAAAHAWHNVVAGVPPIPPLMIQRDALDEPALLAWIEAHALQAVISDSEFDLNLIAAALPARLRRKLVLVSTNIHPPLAQHRGIDEKPALVGAAAVDVLAAMIQRGERGLPESPRTILIAGEYTEPVRAKRTP